VRIGADRVDPRGMSAWRAQVLASGVLVWDEDGRLLMVKTHNRST
jgi:hypothetical protein